MSVERTGHQLFACADLEDTCLMRLPGHRLSRSIVEKDLYDKQSYYDTFLMIAPSLF